MTRPVPLEPPGHDAQQGMRGRHRTTVVIADDHPIVLAGLESLLRGEEDIDVVARCTGGVETLGAVDCHRPDILLLDLCMPGVDGWAVLRQLKRAGSSTRVVVLADVLDDGALMEVLRLGCRGVVLKEMAPRCIVDCVRKVKADERWFEPSVMHAALDNVARQQAGAAEVHAALSRREVEVARALAQGLRNREIGQRLAIAEGTVKLHLHAIYTKLKVDSRLTLILKLRDKGFAG